MILLCIPLALQKNVLLQKIAATIFWRNRAYPLSVLIMSMLTPLTDLYLLLMPGDKPFRTKFLSRQLGCARLSFATPEQMLAHLGVTPGSVSLLGLIQDKDHAVRLLIDNDLLSDEYLGCHPCMNTSSLKLRMEDVLKKIIPATGHGITYVDLPWNSEET